MPNRLFLGNRRYSSWSLRGWLAVRLAGLDVEDIVIPMSAGVTQAIKEATPAGLVPVLEHNGLTIWDSLAIAEYCAEQSPSLWPADPAARAIARSVAAEMHSGFRDMRIALPMNLFRTSPPRECPPEALADIARIDAVWSHYLRAHAGPYLFGPTPTIADVMYAPVAARFLTYTPTLSPQATAYCQTLRAHPLLQRWYTLAEAEPPTWRLAKYE